MLHLEEHKAIKKRIYEQYKAAFADIEEITMNPMFSAEVIPGRDWKMLIMLWLSRACLL